MRAELRLLHAVDRAMLIVDSHPDSKYYGDILGLTEGRRIWDVPALCAKLQLENFLRQ